MSELQTFPSATPSAFLQQFQYGYDNADNITGITDVIDTNDQTFTYDPLNRLLSASGPYGPLSYAYDKIGNMTLKEGMTLTYPASGASSVRPHAVISTSDGWTMTYDAAGNLTKKESETVTKTFTYDVENRMVSAPGATYVYDADGARVKETIGASTTTFIGNLIEIPSSGSTTKHIFAGSDRIAAKMGTVFRYYHADHLGSTSVVTDAAGAAIERIRYKPYGNTQADTAPAVSAHKFTGQRLDSSGLYFYNARYYDPHLGRFTQADTIVANPTDPQDLNRYAYCRNNPVNLIDPSGHGWLKSILPKLLENAVRSYLGGTVWGAALGQGVREATEAAVNGERAIGRAFAEGVAVGAAKYTTHVVVVGSTVALFPEVATARLVAGRVTDKLNEKVENSVRGFFAVPEAAAAEFTDVDSVVFLNNDRVTGGAGYRYEASTHNYRDMGTGRFVAPRNLPYPKNSGFRAEWKETLQPGRIIDRYGKPSGRVTASPGDSIAARGMAPGSENLPYHQYRLLKPLDVQAGPAARVPEFGANGGAIQHVHSRSITELLRDKYLEEVLR